MARAKPCPSRNHVGGKGKMTRAYQKELKKTWVWSIWALQMFADPTLWKWKGRRQKEYCKPYTLLTHKDTHVCVCVWYVYLPVVLVGFYLTPQHNLRASLLIRLSDAADLLFVIYKYIWYSLPVLIQLEGNCAVPSLRCSWIFSSNSE